MDAKIARDRSWSRCTFSFCRGERDLCRNFAEQCALQEDARQSGSPTTASWCACAPAP